MSVATETIYRAVYDGRLGLEPKACLRSRRGRRKSRSTRTWRPGDHLGELTSIHARGVAVNERRQPRHWEGDLIIGRYNQSAMITLIERATRLMVLLQLPKGYGTTAVTAALIAWLADVPEPMRGASPLSQVRRHLPCQSRTPTQHRIGGSRLRVNGRRPDSFRDQRPADPETPARSSCPRHASDG